LKKQFGRAIEAPRMKSVFRKFPVASYFCMTFVISWAGALAVASPHLIRHEALPSLTGILMFPAMLVGPALSGIVLKAVVDGRVGLPDLFSRVIFWRFGPRWYAFLLIPPAAVLGTLLFLQRSLGPEYSPNLFWIGITFGIPAGILEEIGWTGFAFPKLCERTHAFTASVIVGVLWVLWHLPVINFLGAATPHRDEWWIFFLAFGVPMSAMRVLIGCLYVNTRSVLAAQLMHISSTGSLVIFGPARVSTLQESFWYASYGVVLWLAVAVVVSRKGREFRLVR
jgi:CAAX protease family protein